jgi:hypothetical protein
MQAFPLLLDMKDRDVRPGERSPVTGEYEELNVFGSRTGKMRHMDEGEALPSAPRGFSWRVVMRRAAEEG